MTGATRVLRRLRIERLEIDLRGIAPATAETAARALGPALARALESSRAPITPADRLDAGRITSTATPDAGDLASGIAKRIARTLRGEAS